MGQPVALNPSTEEHPQQKYFRDSLLRIASV